MILTKISLFSKYLETDSIDSHSESSPIKASVVAGTECSSDKELVFVNHADHVW